MRNPERLLMNLLDADNPRKILEGASKDEIVSLIDVLRASNQLDARYFPQNVDSMPLDRLVMTAADIFGALSDGLEHQREHSHAVSSLARMDSTAEDGSFLTHVQRNSLDVSGNFILPRDKKNWLSMTKLLKALGRDNDLKDSAKTQLCLQVLFTPDRKHSIGGKNYFSKELFGFFYKNGHRATYYTNPIAVPLIRQELGLLPMLPDDGVHRVSLTDMSKRVGNKKPEHVGRVKAIADRLLLDPDQLLSVDTQSNTKKPVRDLVGYYHLVGRYRGTLSTLFFAPEMEGYLMAELDAYPPLPRERRHFLSEHTILEKIECGRTPWNKKALREILSELSKTEQVSCSGQMRPASECIGLYRHGGRGDGKSYYIDPGLISEALTHEAVVTRAAELKKMENTVTEARAR